MALAIREQSSIIWTVRKAQGVQYIAADLSRNGKIIRTREKEVRVHRIWWEKRPNCCIGLPMLWDLKQHVNEPRYGDAKRIRISSRVSGVRMM